MSTASLNTSTERLTADRGPAAYWPKSYSQLAIIAVFIVLALFAVIFFQQIMPIPILVLGFGVICFFFIGFNVYSVRWDSLDEKKFTRRLFWHSFLYRLIFVAILYLLTWFLDRPSFPFEIMAADSWTYHGTALELSKVLFSGKFFTTLNTLFYSKDDFGFPTYLSTIYALFGSNGNAFLMSIPVRLLNCLWGSLTVVLISKIARMIFSDEHARLAGIIAMLMPPFLLFGAMSLKEILMIFLIVLAVYYATKTVYSRRISPVAVAVMLVSCFLLFFFRVFLAGLVVSCIAFWLFLAFGGRKWNPLVVVAVLILFGAGEYYLARHAGFTRQFTRTVGLARLSALQTSLGGRAAQVGVNVDVASTSKLQLLVAPLAPFPAFLNLEERQLPNLVSYQDEVVRNIMYFFAFAGILFSLRKKWREIFLLLSLSLGNMMAVGFAGFAIYDRYQLPALPFLIIFMAEGVKRSTEDKRVERAWVIYLLVIMVVMVGWNLYKLRIRGAL